MRSTYAVSRVSAFSSLAAPSVVIAALWMPSVAGNTAFRMLLLAASVLGPPVAVAFGCVALLRCRTKVFNREDLWLAVLGIVVGIPTLWLTFSCCALFDVRN